MPIELVRKPASATNGGEVSTEAQDIPGDKSFQGSVALDPTQMNDVDATKLGLKIYRHGTTYNGGNAPTITVTGTTLSSVDGSAFIPYQMQDGSWRLKGNYKITVTADTTLTIEINGITYASGYHQTAAVDDESSGSSITRARITPGTDEIVVNSSASVAQFSAAFDVELDSKPTWAY